jgi:hypothetical protein
VREFLVCKQTTVMQHPPNSTTLTPSQLASVSEGKGNIERRHFDDIDGISSNTTRF